MKIYTANYIYWKKPVNALIAGWTWIFNPLTEPSSHTEGVVLKDGEWQCFSSTNRDGAHGTRWEKPEIVFKHPERWTFYEKETTEEYVSRLIKRCNSIIPSDYDWVGLCGFIDPTGRINDRNKWYCSEAWWYALASCIKRVSPRRIIKWIKKLGFEKCSLESIPFLQKNEKEIT